MRFSMGLAMLSSFLLYSCEKESLHRSQTSKGNGGQSGSLVTQLEDSSVSKKEKMAVLVESFPLEEKELDFLMGNLEKTGFSKEEAGFILDTQRPLAPDIEKQAKKLGYIEGEQEEQVIVKGREQKRRPFRPENPANPFDEYGRQIMTSVEFANSVQREIESPSTQVAIERWESDAVTAFSQATEGIRPDIDTTTRVRSLERVIYSGVARAWNIQDPRISTKVIKAYEFISLILPERRFNNSVKTRTLSTLASIRYMKASQAVNGFVINGEEYAGNGVDVSAAPCFCVRFDFCMNRELQKTFESVTSTLFFIASAGANTLKQGVTCAEEAIRNC